MYNNDVFVDDGSLEALDKRYNMAMERQRRRLNPHNEMPPADIPIPTIGNVFASELPVRYKRTMENLPPLESVQQEVIGPAETQEEFVKKMKAMYGE